MVPIARFFSIILVVFQLYFLLFVGFHIVPKDNGFEPFRDDSWTITAGQTRKQEKTFDLLGEEKKINGKLRKSPYAYAFVIWNVEPGNYKKYGEYLASVLISAKLLRRYGSGSDILLMVRTIFQESGAKHLPDWDVNLLKQYGVQVRYLPNEPQDISSQMMNKFYVYNLTEYRRVTLLDSDVIPLGNIDYVMELSDQGVLEPTVVYSLGREPSNGGFFVVEPSREDFEVFLKYLANHSHIRKTWNRTLGWGHVIMPPDHWETSWKMNGTQWTYYAAKTDQGFLYYHSKYIRKRLTQVLGHKVVTFRDVHSKSVALVREQLVNVPEDSPFWNYSRVYYPKIKPRFCSSHSGQKNFCPPLYRDFSHFTGPRKPSMLSLPDDFPNDPIETDISLWWHTLFEIVREQNITLVDLGLRNPLQPIQ